MLQLVALFLHVAAALGMAAAFGTEAVSLAGLRRSGTAAQARDWLAMRRLTLVLGPGSLALLLVTGVYLAALGWGAAGWIVASVAGLAAVALTGGLLTGLPTARLERELDVGAPTISDAAARVLGGRALPLSLALRVGITLGVLMLMIAKPGLVPSLTVLAAGAALGGATAIVFPAPR